MDRLFQDDHGDVAGLAGASFSSAMAVVGTADRNVVVLWLEDDARSCWYRIFIDGIYCGIDRYRRCEIEEDLDEGYDAVDHIDLFVGWQLRRAGVTNHGEGAAMVIKLRLELENDTAVILSHHVQTGHCSLKVV